MARMNSAPAQTEQLCRLLSPADQTTGKQGLQYNVGISAQSCGSERIHMQLVTIPPGGRALAHKHDAHETAIYALQGESGVWYGSQLEHHAVVKTGDFFYIPAGVPHLPYNPSTTSDVIAVIARTDANEQESVVLLPELDRVHPR